MGSGIAQVAAQNGFYTLLFDINTEVLEKGRASIQKNLQWLTLSFTAGSAGIFTG